MRSGRYGTPRLRAGDRAVRAAVIRGWLDNDQPTLGDWIMSPTRDDNFQPCVLDFGTPPAATVRTVGRADLRLRNALT